MHKRHSGFTIVELLIVVVIIAILATITIVSYNGIQKRAQNVARFTEISQIMKIIDIYKADKGEYPDFTNGKKLCLGTGFPNNKCGEYIGTSNSFSATDLEATNLLSTIGSLSKTHYPVQSSVGPYIDSWNYGFSLIGFVQGEDAEGDICTPLGNNFTVWWNDSDSDRLQCARDYLLNVDTH